VRALLLALLAGCIIVPARPLRGPPPPPPPGDDSAMTDPRPPPPQEAPQEAVQDAPPPPPPAAAPRPVVRHRPPSPPRYTPPAPPPPHHKLAPGENPFPEDGPHLTDAQLDAIPFYDRNKQYSFGAMVRDSYSSEPHTLAFRCGEETCTGSPSGNGWVNAGWY
jgi:hypothetical protein